MKKLIAIIIIVSIIHLYNIIDEQLDKKEAKKRMDYIFNQY